MTAHNDRVRSAGRCDCPCHQRPGSPCDCGWAGVGDPRFTRALHEPPPERVGTRLELLNMPDDPCPIEPGTQGVVTGGNAAQMWVRWDNGRSLMLVPGVDTWRVLP